MKLFGIVSYNIYCNFTNYGSALQSWALQRTIDRLGAGQWKSVLVDYCPDVLRDKDPRNPVANMWDTDDESKRMCQLSLPAILENADKFDTFYRTRFRKTSRAYTSEQFHEIMMEEALDGFVCGSDTIFCIDEFDGFDDGYYANYPCMRGRSVAYAASFGDAQFDRKSFLILKDRLQNFKAIGLRENAMLPFVEENVTVPVRRVLDPTLLLTAEEYESITAPKVEERPYLLLYTRRYDPRMSAYAENLAKEKGWEIIEISLRAINAEKHRMFYEAGVEEFLSLVKYAQFVVTNSYHGMIFSVQFHKRFAVFSREQCNTKISELLNLMDCHPESCGSVDYRAIDARLMDARSSSLSFLQRELSLLAEDTGIKKR